MDVSRLLISEPAPDSPTTRPNKVPRMENNGGPSSPATTGFGGEPIERKPNHFGDILAPREITTVLPAGFTGLERIILSANGNLQRIMSAYYNSPVSVEIIKNDRVGQTSIFEREVNLTCFGKAFCNAKSTVTIKKEEHLRLVLEEKVGIGQLFFHLRLLPSFVLLQAGRSGGVALWREYRLEADSIVCEIREEFVADLFDLRPESMEAGQMKSLVDWDAYVRDFHPDLDLPSVDNVWKWNRTKPLTLAFFIQQLQAKKLVKDFEDLETSSPFRVVILGGNPEEEENALEFWGDALEKVLHLVEKDRRLDIVMIGPQVSPERHNTSVDLTLRLRITFYKGRFHDYREDLVDDKKYEDPHMFLAYHSGFHFYIESWTSTLVALFNDGVVGCFTSHDLQDENKQWQWLTGCCDFETLLEPSTNPFRCDRKERKRAYNDRLFAIRGLPDSLYVFASSGPRRLEKGE